MEVVKTVTKVIFDKDKLKTGLKAKVAFYESIKTGTITKVEDSYFTIQDSKGGELVVTTDDVLSQRMRILELENVEDTSKVLDAYIDEGNVPY